MYNSIQFSSVEDKSTPNMRILSLWGNVVILSDKNEMSSYRMFIRLHKYTNIIKIVQTWAEAWPQKKGRARRRENTWEGNTLLRNWKLGLWNIYWNPWEHIEYILKFNKEMITVSAFLWKINVSDKRHKVYYVRDWCYHLLY